MRNSEADVGLYGYPDWAVPCYEIDEVFFSQSSRQQ